MATFASSAYHGTRYVKEEEFGVIPPSPALRGLRHTSNSLILTRDSFQSEELRSDAQISDLRLGNRRSGGDIGIEFSYGEYDDFLEAGIRATGWQADAEEGSEFIIADIKQTTFTIERIFNDIQQYQVFTGCGINTMTLNVETNAMVTGTISIVGKDVEFFGQPLDADPDPSKTASPFDGFKGKLLEGGAEIAVITAIELVIENSMDPAFVIGSDSAVALNPGRINVSGTVSAFFQDTDLLQKFATETESSLVFWLGDGVKQSYKFTLPRIKYSGGDNPVDGEGPVTLSMPFQALYDDCSGTNIRIDRYVGSPAADCAMTYAPAGFTESATVPGTFPDPVMATITGGSKTKTFNGFIGQEVPGVIFGSGLPAGLTGKAIKKSNTEVNLFLEGTASTAIADGFVEVTFGAASLVFGFCHCPNNGVTDGVKNLTITAAAAPPVQTLDFATATAAGAVLTAIKGLSSDVTTQGQLDAMVADWAADFIDTDINSDLVTAAAALTPTSGTTYDFAVAAVLQILEDNCTDTTYQGELTAMQTNAGTLFDLGSNVTLTGQMI